MDIIYSMVIIVNNTIFHILSQWQRESRLIVAIISQCIQILNHYAVQLKLMLSIIPRWKKLEHPLDHRKSKFQKNIYFCFIMPKPLTVWLTINCGKFWKRWEYQTTWPACWETYMQVRKQQLELDMEQQTGSK